MDEPVANENRDDELSRLRHENSMLTSGGIIEVAIRNPNVAEYMRHWEGRAERAERALAALTPASSAQ